MGKEHGNVVINNGEIWQSVVNPVNPGGKYARLLIITNNH